MAIPSISVLISIYKKENPDYFHKAMESIWDRQILKPQEVVLVGDGPLTKELYQVLDFWSQKLGNALVRVKLEKNSGLAVALNQGLKFCKGEYIARMDTDDISTPERFAKQVEFMQNNPDVDVVGTWICEIDEDNNLIKAEVKYPLSHDELFKFMEKRSPFAHPSVMFRRSFFLKAGEYPSEALLFEDLMLWVHGFQKGCRFANIPLLGLKFRRTKAFYQRRSDINRAVSLLRARFTSINPKLGYGFSSYVYALAYFLISISPPSIKRVAYKFFR